MGAIPWKAGLVAAISVSNLCVHVLSDQAHTDGAPPVASSPYWDEQPANDDSVVGHVGLEDIRDTAAFFARNWPLPRAWEHRARGATPKAEGGSGGVVEQRESVPAGATSPLAELQALDLGAGVGRVTRDLLLPLGFGRVHLVEQAQHFVDQARKDLAKEYPEAAVTFQVSTLEKLELPRETYDLVLAQGVWNYLKTSEIRALLFKVRHSVRPDGRVFIKDNVAMPGSTEDYQMFHDGTQLVRREGLFEDYFREAGFRIVDTDLQTDFPDDWFPVRMWWLVPDETSSSTGNYEHTDL